MKLFNFFILSMVIIASAGGQMRIPLSGDMDNDGVIHIVGPRALEVLQGGDATENYIKTDKFIGSSAEIDSVSMINLELTNLYADIILDTSGQIVTGYVYDKFTFPAGVTSVTYALPVSTHKLTDVLAIASGRVFPWKRNNSEEQAAIFPIVGDWWGADGGIRIVISHAYPTDTTVEIRYAFEKADAPIKMSPYGGHTQKTIKAPTYFSGLKVGFGL